MSPSPIRPPVAALWLALLGLCASGVQAQDRMVYRCPGNLYTDQLSTREAAERGCKTLEGAPVTVLQTTRRPDPARPASAAAPASGPRPAGETRIDPAEQRARDSDARRILDAELRKEEERLAQLQGQLQKDAGNAELKAGVARKEADVAAIRRELNKLGTP